MNKQRRSEIKNAVIKTLQAYREPLKLPVPIKAITKSFPNIRLISYSKQMERRGLSYDEMVAFAGTEDAFTDYNAKTGLFLVYYNDVASNQLSSNRYRWNIAHELGHIALKHHQTYTGSRIFRSSLSKTLYRELEDEADTFAAYILVPHIVVNFVGADFDTSTLRESCGISGAAAKYRQSCIQNWRQHSGAEKYDFALLDHFCDFVEVHSRSESVKSWLTAHRSCSACKVHIPDKSAAFCHTCGAKYIGHYEMEQKIMEYPGIQTHENLRASECPVCHNTDFTENGNYCIICGQSLINMCTSGEFFLTERCDQLLPGNARYCPHCGSETSFLKRGLLKTWDGMKYFDGELTELPF